MAMILESFMEKSISVLTDLVQEEVIMLLGVKGELQKLRRTMESIQTLLKDAERRKFDDPSIDHWLSQLKDVMYDADDIFDLCRIQGPELLADRNFPSEPPPVCSILSSVFHCFTSAPLRHEIGNKIKELNDRLNQIHENRKKLKLDKSEVLETSSPITLVNTIQTSSMVDDQLVVKREVNVAANELVNYLIAEEVQTKCRVFAVVGMGGIGKTTLAQQIFNHTKIVNHFNLKVWACVSNSYSEIELLKLVIREAKGDYGNANTKSELHRILTETVVSGKSLFLVLDDVWRADVWNDLLRVPLQNANISVRVLVTTRSKIVADDMNVARIHPVEKLSKISGWNMLCKLIFSEGQEELANELKDLGYEIVERCKGLPLAIKAIHSVLKSRCTRIAWENVLRNHAWSMSNLPEQFRGALYLNFEDLPSYLKQCFLYFSLYPEDDYLIREHDTRYWVAEGFVKEEPDLLMEDLAENYFNELVKRSFLMPQSDSEWSFCNMHDLIRALALFLSKEETSCGDANMESSSTSIKLRRLSVKGNTETATEILDSVAELGALRTLIASYSNLLLNDKRLRKLSCLRVLDISDTQISTLPDSIGNLVRLRYLNLSNTDITAIPGSIENLAYLQFLNIQNCRNLTHLPTGITRLRNLRCLNLFDTPLNIIPKGIENLQQLNHLEGFEVINNDSSCKLEELSSLKQIRRLSIFNLKRAQSEANILTELTYLSYLWLHMPDYLSEPTMEEKLAANELFDKLAPPRSLKKLEISCYIGIHFPSWMGLSSFKICVPHLTQLTFYGITSCTQLPPLGQLPELRELTITNAEKVEKIGPEFLGGGIKSTVHLATWIAFAKLELLIIESMPLLEEWSFGAQVEPNASPKLKLLPCLQKLKITECPLLKQLPKGLRHSALKSLHIEKNNNLISLVNLPQVLEELELVSNKNLINVCRLPALKYLRIESCEALSRVEKLDKLQKLKLHFCERDSLPDWLLLLLQGWVLQNDTNGDFWLKLKCPRRALEEIMKGGSHWDTIKHIPEVNAYAFEGGYLSYIKEPYVYDTDL